MQVNTKVKNILNKKKMIIFNIFIINIIISLLTIASLNIIKKMINYGIVLKNLKFLNYTFILLVLTYISIAILKLLNKYISSKLTLYLMYKIRIYILSSFTKIRYSEIEKKKNTSYVNRIENDTRNVISFYNKILENISIDIILILLSFYSIYKISILLFIFLILLLFIYFILTRKFNRIYSKKLKKYLKNKEDTFIRLNDCFSYLKVLKIFKCKNTFTIKYSNSYKKFRDSNLDRLYYDYKFQSLYYLINKIYPIVIYLIGGYTIIRGKSSLGDITISISFLTIIINSFNKLLQLNSSFQIFKVSLARLDEVLTFSKVKKEKISYEIRSIEFKNISYKKVLHHINFKVSINEKILVTGPNGSGKTVLLKIISGLLPPDNGEIIINDRITITKENYYLMQNFTQYIDSHSPFFKGTIKENLINPLSSYFHEVYKNKIFDFVKLSDEFQEKNYSLGQYQKLRILRGFNLLNQINCHDEIFSNLDTKSSLEIQKLISKKNNVITFYTTHLNSTSINQDKVIVLDNN